MDAAVMVDELDALLEQVGKRGYLWHQFGMDRHGPDVLAGVFQWRDCADVLVLIDEDQTHAYRMPTSPDTDVFAPSQVYWWYGSSNDIGIVWVIRALLTLPAPGEPGGRPALLAAPAGTGVPGERTPVRIRRRPDRSGSDGRADHTMIDSASLPKRDPGTHLRRPRRDLDIDQARRALRESGLPDEPETAKLLERVLDGLHRIGPDPRSDVRGGVDDASHECPPMNGHTDDHR